MNEKILTIGILGAGRWGPNHIRNFNALPGCRVSAVADPNPARLDAIANLHPGLAVSSDPGDILKSDRIDAVVVATPTSTHYRLVKTALEAGKHVLCEKPLTADSGQAWELAGLAEKSGRILMVGHVFLFNPGIEYLGNAVSGGEAGRLYYVSAVRTNLGPFRYDVNAAWDLASHDIYIINHLAGSRPLAAAAVGGKYLQDAIEDIVFLTLSYPGGLLGHIHVSWLDPKKIRQITVVGERKMITWDDLGVPGPVAVHDRMVVREPQYRTFGEFQLLSREGDVVLPRIPSREPLAAQAAAFRERCRGGKDDERGTARQGAEVVDILEAVDKSLSAGGALTEVTYGS